MPMFIMGATNDSDRLWIVDTDKGTIETVDSNGGEGKSGAADLSSIQKLRRNGYSVIRDVDVAVLINEAAQPSSRQFTE